MNIIIGSDHAAYNLKCSIKTYLSNCDLIDVGCDGDYCDYPIIAAKACNKVLEDEDNIAILLCGTGIGMSIAANKIKGIRAAVCAEHFSAKYARMHNNANVLCMGARVIGEGLARELADVFLSTKFEGERHQKRLDFIKEIEDKRSY